jgi:phosphopantothenoylcysteine decarboxylase/phosphopantothenate--cysteine ligase
LRSRRVVLGVCGSIAAYKSVEICRRLVDAGAHVSPVMTADAERFVGSATLSALASEPVHDSLWADAEPIPHTTLGRSADVVLVAPATATLLAKYAAGIADDLLTATLLATRAPVVVCPAMHAEMWEHPATVDNVARLRARGVAVVEPGRGRLAGGDEGAGRLAETADVLAALERALAPQDLLGRTVLVTSGGTREPIDPVRFIGNRSSGKQGDALVAEAVSRGASVVLVTASGRPAPAGAVAVRVETAAEMEAATLAHAAGADVVIMAAAVADFRPKEVAGAKLEKADGVPELVLEPTTDILAELGRRKRPGQVLVGFAAETGDVGARAARKLHAKNLDLLVANDVTLPRAGFEHDTNQASVFDAGGGRLDVPLTEKRALAAVVVDVVVGLLSAQGLPEPRGSGADGGPGRPAGTEGGP